MSQFIVSMMQALLKL